MHLHLFITSPSRRKLLLSELTVLSEISLVAEKGNRANLKRELYKKTGQLYAAIRKTEPVKPVESVVPFS